MLPILRRPLRLAALALFLALSGPAAATTGLDATLLAATLERAASFPRLRTLIVARNGVPLVERVFRGPGLDRPVNIKSAAKSVLSALIGIAIDRGVLEGIDQPVAPILGPLVPADADPRVQAITVGHLLGMRAGLERTSGPNYGRWVTSRDWVRFALSRPFVDEPGGRMLYSTGSSHLLSAVLTRASGRSTLALARDWLGEPLGITIPPWPRDPQGFYFGGNDMLLSPRALLRFGELYRQGGKLDGLRVLPESWVRDSWTPQVASPFTGHAYGYGWFVAEAGSHRIHYAWGYGGQMLYVVPSLALTVVMTSDPDHPSGRDGFVQELHGLLADGIIPAAERGGGEAERS
jgi:CubicO group peptidase (beta-lactamase class C family)